MSQKNKKSNRFFDFVKGNDVFTESVKFTFNNGKTEFKTGIGGIFTILMFTIIGGYALWQAAIMFRLEKFTIVERTQNSKDEAMRGLDKE